MENHNKAINNRTTHVKRDDIQFQQNNPDKPILVARYRKKWIVGWIIFLAFCLFFFGLGTLYYTQQPDEGYYEYLFVKIGAWGIVFWIIYLFIDVLNVERFEIYEDRIEKKVRFFRNLPILGNKTIYFDTAYFRYAGYGIVICNCRFLLPFRGILFFIMFLPSEEISKTVGVLSQKSGRSKSLFASFGVVSFTKKFKRDKNNIWDIF